MKRMQLALAGLAVATVMGMNATDAEARRGHSHYSVSISTGGFHGHYHRPVVVPRPVVYPAYTYAPVYVAPAPVVPVYGYPACGGASFSFTYHR